MFLNFSSSVDEAFEQLNLFQADVTIIGAGTSGCTLAHLLRKQNLRVLLVDRGDMDGAKMPSSKDLATQVGTYYRGDKQGRCFGFGGTSSMWGGQMLELTASDLSKRLNGKIGEWPIQPLELQKFYRKARIWLGLSAATPKKWIGKDPLTDNVRVRDEWKLRFSAWIPHKQRNIGKRLRKKFLNDPDILVVLGIEVQHLDLNHSARDRVSGITISSAGKVFSYSTTTVVLCCGTIESTRLMLRSFPNNSSTQPLLGKYFADHLSTRYAKILYKGFFARYLLNYHLMSRFQSGIMYTPRFELDAEFQEKHQVTNTYAHFTIENPPYSGFDLVRKLFRRLQGFHEPLSIKLVSLPRVISDLCGLVFWRIILNRLYIPSGAVLYLQVDGEQVPDANSRIFYDEKGKFCVDWKISATDIDSIRTVGDLMIRRIKESRLGKFVEIQKEFKDGEFSEHNLYDVFHPTGALRMGTSPENSVVDWDLKVWGIDGLYINSTAVFPSSGAANPGLTHFALTFRLSDHLAQIFSRKQ